MSGRRYLVGTLLTALSITACSNRNATEPDVQETPEETTASSGIGWEHPQPTGDWFNAVHGFSLDDVFGVTDNGDVYRFDGSSWRRTLPGGGLYLLSVWGSAPDDVFAVGHGGRIVHFDGAEWVEMTSGTTNRLWDVHGTGPDDVWAVGKGPTILHYDGIAWSPHALSTNLPPASLDAVFAVTPTSAWAVTHDEAVNVYHYDGTSWSPRAPSFDIEPADVAAHNVGSVWVVGRGGKVARYTGFSWSEETLGSHDLLSVHAVAGTTDLVVVGQDGEIYRRRGDTWTEEVSPSGRDLTSVWTDSVDEGFATGHRSVLRLSASGPRETAVLETFRSLAAVGATPDGSAAFAVGENGTVLRYDGSAWRIEDTRSTASLRGVYAASANEAVAVGENAGAGVILHLSGGVWAETSVAAPLYGVSGRSASDVIAVGGSTILHYDGTTWAAMPEDVSVPMDLRGVCVQESGAAVACGIGTFSGLNGGLVIRWNGAEWEDDYGSLDVELLAITADGDARYAVGRYTDGREASLAFLYFDGDNWTQSGLTSPAIGFPSLTSVAAESGSVVTAGAGGVYRLTSDGWQSIHATSLLIHGVSRDGRGGSFLVGSGGNVVRYTP